MAPRSSGWVCGYVSRMNIAILGAGAWGAALAIALTQRHCVSLWARDAEQREALRRDRRSRFLPEIQIPAAVAVAEHALEALDTADLALIVTPTAGLRASAQL